MNECSWCQPRPITRYTTLTQCLAACPTPASSFAAGKEEEGMPPPRRRRGTANVQRRFPSYVPFTPFGPLTEELAAS